MRTEVPVRVALFAKAPVAGRVKTRLAADIGEAAALQAHRTLVAHALRNLAGSERFRLELWCSDDHAEARGWAQHWRIPFRLQQGEDLGLRMAHCLSELCRSGGRGIIVGCDCPEVDAAYVEQAAAALDAADLVLGPAEDGGYGLIGWGQADPPPIFHDVAWGTDRVLEETLRLADAAGISVSLLPTIWDVDAAADWRRFEGMAEDG